MVAAPSRAAALRAWGVNQNLFASGEAQQVSDAETILAATAHPETPLRRAVGSQDPFALEPTGLPEVPDAPSQTKARRSAQKPKPVAQAKPPADRSRLDAAEQALSDLDDQRRREEADFRQQAEDLEARRMAAQDAYVAARKVATAKVVDARGAFRKAGGVG